MYSQRVTQIRATEATGQRDSSSKPPFPAHAPVHPILQLQQTIGNQAVQRLIQSRTLQPKLSISHPGDVYEQEADRVAEKVMRMPAPTLQRACAPCAAGGPPCPKRDVEKGKLIQRKTESASDTADGSVPDNFLQHLGPGQPLGSATRAYFEPRFGHDFSQVRIHTDARAAESARTVNALAYTVGQDIVFSEGQYNPATPAGRNLLAHELTHFAQQGGTRPLPGPRRQPVAARPGFLLQRHPKQTPFPRRCDYVERNFPTSGVPHCCTATMLRELRALSDEAFSKVRSAMRKLINQPASLAKPLQAHFGVSPSNAVHVRTIATQLMHMRDAARDEAAMFLCRDAGDDNCTRGGLSRAISTNCPGSTLPYMLYCGNYNDKLFLGRSWLKTVIHEYAHVGCPQAGMVLDASSESYKGQGGYPPTPAERAIKNADSYAHFVMEVG